MEDAKITLVGKGTKIFITIWAVLLVFGCQTISFDPRGRTVAEAQRITIPESGERVGVYNTEDLTLAYRMVRSPGQLNISGEIHFSDRLAENFPIVRYFHLDAILVDARGKVLEMTGLTSTAYFRTQYATPSDFAVTFKTPVAAGENVQAVAFSYTGKAFDINTSDGSFMDFWEYPIY